MDMYISMVQNPILRDIKVFSSDKDG